MPRSPRRDQATPAELTGSPKQPMPHISKGKYRESAPGGDKTPFLTQLLANARKLAPGKLFEPACGAAPGTQPNLLSR